MKLSFCGATSSVVLGLLSCGCSGSNTNLFSPPDGLGGAASTSSLGGAASNSSLGGTGIASSLGGSASTSSLGGASESDGGSLTNSDGGAATGSGGDLSDTTGGATSTTTGGEAGAAVVTTGNDDAGASGSNDAGAAGGPNLPACANGCCGSAPAAGTVADSSSGFSATQGDCGWSYGEVIGGLLPFVELTVYDTTQTQYSSPAWLESTIHPPWLSIQSTLQHPGPLKWIDRRWTSTVSGTLSIRGHVAKSDLQGGDGVIAHVRAADVDLWNTVLAFNDSKGKDFNLSARVSVGTNIDFLIEAGPDSDNDHDLTLFTAVITR